MEKINFQLQNKLSESKQENVELKAKYELEIKDYRNAMCNLELKFNGLTQNSEIQVIYNIKKVIFLKKIFYFRKLSITMNQHL